MASTMSARMCSLSMASLWAKLTAPGQYGQVGVMKTCMCTGVVMLATASLVASPSPDSPLDTSMMPSMSVVNSKPEGMR